MRLNAFTHPPINSHLIRHKIALILFFGQIPTCLLIKFTSKDENKGHYVALRGQGVVFRVIGNL